MRKSILAKIIAFVILAVSVLTFTIACGATVFVYDEKNLYTVPRNDLLDDTCKWIYKNDAKMFLSEAVHGSNTAILKRYEEGLNVAMCFKATKGEPEYYSSSQNTVLYKSEDFDSFACKYIVEYPAMTESVFNTTTFMYEPSVYDVTLKIGQRPSPISEDTLLSATMFVYDYKDSFIPAAIVSALVALASFIFLLAAAGHVKDPNKRVRFFVRIPADIYAVFALCVLGMTLACFSEFMYDAGEYPFIDLISLASTLSLAVLIDISVVFGTAVLMNIKYRIMLGKWWRNSLVYKLAKMIFKWIKKFFSMCVRLIKKLPYIWKTVVALAVVNFWFLVFAIATVAEDDSFVVVLLLIMFVCDLGMIYYTLMLDRLRNASKRIAAGGDASIDTKYMVGDIKETANTLEHIKSGIDSAVDARIKSERTKTALITNVSHDIKTPLTSIINYSDLICAEECENEKIKEYSEVLRRQSERLKKLIEDLIEASKASSGVIELKAEPMDIGILVEQVMVEYEEKLQNAGLELVVNRSEEPLMVMADGRRMWRVLDNLFNNACKYSMYGTRVYLDVKKAGTYAAVSLKNISSARLNVSAEELMERFARGDESRTAEGNGLGLSIAKDLTKVQGGEFNISVDGDLFKAEVMMKLL